MHEYPLTLQILETAGRYAAQNGAERVTAIYLVVGDDAGCVAESIALYFDLIAADGPCAGAELHIERVKPLLRCGVCGRLFARKPFSFGCPFDDCGGEGLPTEIGREFFIKAVEVE